MNLVDIGANLSHESFAHDFDEVVAAALSVGVSRILVTGTDQHSSEAALQLSKTRPEIFRCTAGYHPHVAQDFDEAALHTLHQLANEAEVVAVGETGLDFNRNFSSKASQLHAFEQQLQLGAEVGKPLFLHQRDAHTEFIGILRRYRDKIAGGVVHCFTDSEEALKDYIALDMYIGITGWICDERRGKPLQDIVKHIPSDRLLIETDSPYLLPRTIKPKPKSRRNEPKHLPEVLKMLGNCLTKSPEQLARETTENAIRLFGLDLPGIGAK